MKKFLVLAAAAVLAVPAMASAQGLIGQCADCHTMHNSEQGKAVALQGNATTPTGDANPNLLKMDCIACHASGTSTTPVMLVGQSKVPQVYHNAATDLAGGNFKYVIESGDRKGHNVVDLVAADADNLYAAPGDMRSHNFGAGTANTAFTCAGAVGCHGTRAQLISGYTNVGGGTGGVDVWVNTEKRQGLAAVSGAHHNNYDGLKDPLQNTVAVHDGTKVAAGYRFIQGLKGKGNTANGGADRWQNLSSTSHNEYFGVALDPDDNSDGTNFSSSCAVCHIEGNNGINGGSARMTKDSTLAVPNQSMSGFCMTCHGKFHSAGASSKIFGSVGANDQLFRSGNGSSGAFLRHPSDYVIKNSGEYAAYTTYKISAPVARPDLAAAVTASVAPGTDMVMCLSCHQAHATPNDGMLRFSYADIIAGNTVGTEGCLACHTTKGVAK